MAKKKAKVTPRRDVIRFLLDRSTSMNKIKAEAIDGYNAFVKEQREVEREAKISLAQFDTRFEVTYDLMDIKHAPLLTNMTFVPQGWTAMYDAIGMTLSNALAAEDDPEEQNYLVVMTDGDDNSSLKYTPAAVGDLIKAAEKRGWKMVFLGANIDVTSVSKGMNMGGQVYTASFINQNKVMLQTASAAAPSTTSFTYSTTGDALQGSLSDAYASASTVLRSMRTATVDPSSIATKDESK